MVYEIRIMKKITVIISAGDTDKYMELQDYLDAYYSRLASSNHFKQNDTSEDNTQVRLRKCLNTQKYILENF